MSPESKNRIWLTLLLRWLSGDVTRKEERALETLAKDDPFLSEALEGYRSLPAEEHAAAVTELKVKLRLRYRQRRRGAAFYIVRIAALGLLLVTAWIVFRESDGVEKSAFKIAQTEQKAGDSSSPASSSPEESTLTFDSNDAEGVAALDNTSSQTFNFSQETQPAEEKLAQAEKQAQPAPLARELHPAGKNETTGFADTSVKHAETDEIAAAEHEALKEDARMKTAPATAQMASARDKAAGGQLITGLVTDENGEPLIGVNVLASDNKGTVSDVDGYFSIEVDSSVSMLNLTYTGFETEQVPLKGQTFLNVKMKTGAQLEEVTETGLGTAKKQKQEKVSQPEPKGGFKDFEKYLKKNLRYPEAATQNGMEGKVTLRFQVNENGSLENFEVLNSLGYGCDDEAIRLLKEGPKWKPAGAATFTIKFKQ